MTNEELAQALADLDYVERQEVIERAEELAESEYELPAESGLARVMEAMGL